MRQVSSTAVPAKATQDPQLNWFFTGVTHPEKKHIITKIET
jgi:hypothetical protein